MKTLDNSSMATTPGELAVSREKYAEYYGANVADRWFYRSCSRLPWMLRYLPLIGTRVFHWTQTVEHLKHGCLNPAVVLDSKNGLIAVFTSLTAWGDEPTPVVKILREHLDNIDHSPARNGARFAAASIYLPTEESHAQGRWNDFAPIVIDCLVEDRESCKSAMARIKPLAWKALDMALDSLHGEYVEGLHHVDVPHEIVWNAY